MNSSTNTNNRTRAPSLAGPLLGCLFACGLAPAGEAMATPGAGVTPRSIAIGVLPEAIRARFKAAQDDERTRRDWRVVPGAGEVQPFRDDDSAIDVGDIVMIEYTVAPGGFFGWHKHGGPVWVVIKQGALKLYDSRDATCTGTAYAAGSAFLDAGEHVHNARNEGDVPAVVYGTFMLPKNGALRIDAPRPGVCPF